MNRHADGQLEELWRFLTNLFTDSPLPLVHVYCQLKRCDELLVIHLYFTAFKIIYFMWIDHLRGKLEIIKST